MSRIACLLGLTLLVSCSNAALTGGPGKGGASSESPREDAGDDGAAPDDPSDDADIAMDGEGRNSHDGAADAEGGDDGAGIRFDTDELALPVEQRCWFAVSGTFAGFEWNGKGVHEGRFGKTSSGKPIGPGEGFDTVGGIYLAARAEAYEYGQGGKELDQAVDLTFDSIVVPPGMAVEVREAEGGAVLYEGKGPFIAESGYYEGRDGHLNANLGKSTGYLEAIKQNPDVPPWLARHVAKLAKMPAVKDLHAGKWVKVSVVPGSDCATAFTP